MTGLRDVLGDAALRQTRDNFNTAEKLRHAISELSAHKGELLSHREKAWASITFSGTRHELCLRFTGQDAVDAGEALIAALPDHDFSIPGQLVADAGVAEVDQRFGSGSDCTLTCRLDILMLEDS